MRIEYSFTARPRRAVAREVIRNRCVDLYNGYTLSHVDDTVFYKDTQRR